MEYTGYRYIDEGDLSDFYSGTPIKKEPVKENEFIICRNTIGEPVDYYCYKNGETKKLLYPELGNSNTGIMKPRNPQQYCAMNLLKDRDVPVKLVTGKFGTGKSMMCIVGALEEVQKGNFDKITFIRNNIQVKDTEKLGALPGDQYEKVLPFLMPFADHCGGIDGVKDLLDRGQLEVIPLAYLRGRSIRNSIIYSMESENLTKEHIQLIMGRVDEGSELWMDGDIKQRDGFVFENSRGLETMIERLAGHKKFGYIHLIKSERSEIAAMADLLDD